MCALYAQGMRSFQFPNEPDPEVGEAGGIICYHVDHTGNDSGTQTGPMTPVRLGVTYPGLAPSQAATLSALMPVTPPSPPSPARHAQPAHTSPKELE